MEGLGSSSETAVRWGLRKSDVAEGLQDLQEHNRNVGLFSVSLAADWWPLPAVCDLVVQVGADHVNHPVDSCPFPPPP